MIIALFALSLVMILGGIAAVVQGFPYVRLESGLVMVTGGATAASAGAIVLGIAVALLEVKRLIGTLGRRGGGYAFEAEPVPAATTAPLVGPVIEDPPALTAGRVAATAGAAGLAGITLGAARDLFSRDQRPSPDPRPARSLDAELPLPDLLPPAVPGPVPPPAPGESISTDEDLFASPDDRPGHGPRAAADEPIENGPADIAIEPDPAQEELALRPALEDPPVVPEPETPATEVPVVSEEPPVAEPETPKPGELQVVGTYASGANTYVMFANGTIQAETPRGQFTFQSLDELKAFVDSGGETNTRGAA